MTQHSMGLTITLPQVARHQKEPTPSAQGQADAVICGQREASRPQICRHPARRRGPSPPAAWCDPSLSNGTHNGTLFHSSFFKPITTKPFKFPHKQWFYENPPTIKKTHFLPFVLHKGIFQVNVAGRKDTLEEKMRRLWCC